MSPLEIYMAKSKAKILVVDAVGVGSYPLTLVLDEESRVILVESGTTPVQRMRIESKLEILRP